MGKIYDAYIVGIDHGYKNMKTRSQCFHTAISQIPSGPDDKKGILEYKGNYYDIYGEPVKSYNTRNKAESEEFYLLTLAALGKELSARNIYKGDIYLSAGLPQKWYDSQKEGFKEQLWREKNLKFSFEGRQFDIKLASVNMYLQGHAAALSLIMKKYEKSEVLIVDIGGGTMDIMLFNQGSIVKDKCRIEDFAGNMVTQHIVETIRTELFESVSENYVENFIVNHSQEYVAKNDYEKIMIRCLKWYSSTVFDFLKKYGFNVITTPVIFVGGGSNIIKKYGKYGENMEFVTDICANAKGYEMIDKAILNQKKG